MMKKTHGLKRIGALLICAVLFLTLLPVSFADSSSDYTLPAPELTGLENQGGKLYLTWNPVDGAASYSVHRRENDGAWQTLQKGITSTNYTDTTCSSGAKYTYTVRCNNSAQEFSSWYNEEGLSYSFDWAFATPMLKKIYASASEVTLKWENVDGASRYSVHRKDNGGEWHTLKNDVYDTTYSDTDISEGNSYTYTVRVVDSAGNFASWYDDTGLSCIPGSDSWEFATPHVTGVENTGSGIKITWNTVTDVNRYSIHRRDNGGAWHTLTKDASGGSYTDSTAYSGNVYVYTVRCVNDKGDFASSFETGWEINVSTNETTNTSPSSSSESSESSSSSSSSETSAATTPPELVVEPSSEAWEFPAPVLKPLKNTSSGVSITWEPVAGADRYSVHRREEGGSWHTLTKDVMTNTYTDGNVQNDQKYTYTVRVVNAAGFYVSWYESGNPDQTIVYYSFDKPSFTLSSIDEGIKISWDPVPGASSYSVHRINGGQWVTIARGVWETTYIDKNVLSGESYTYAVRCLNGAGSFASDYDSKSATYYGRGVITGLANRDGFVSVTWRNISAAQYRIFRKANDGAEWKVIDTVPASSGTTYNDTQVVSNTKYTYMVRGLNSAGNYVGDYDSNGVSIRYYDAPELIEAVSGTGGITVTWVPVAGVSKYQVYRLMTNNQWELIGSTPDLYYTDHSINATVRTYTYTVRCVSNDGSSVISWYKPGIQVSSEGKTSVLDNWLETPVLVSATLEGDPGKSSVKLRWIRVDGAETYTIWRKTINTSWAEVETIDFRDLPYDEDSSTFTYKDFIPISGTDYWYSVSCTDYEGYKSQYNFDGIKVDYYEYPPIMDIHNAVNGVYLKWNVVDGTSTYQVYRKIGDNFWKKIGTSTTTSYTDTTVSNHVVYSYAVSSMDVGDNLLSDHFENGVRITFYSTPALKSVSNGGYGAEVRWSYVDTINTYIILRKEQGSSKWVEVGTSEGTSCYYCDTTAVSGKTYSYTVRCKAVDGTLSAYNSTGLSLLYLKTPGLNTTKVASDSITVTWQSIDGATGYDIYRKIHGASIKQYQWIGHINADHVHYVDKDGLVSGQEYDYTVRATNGDVKSWFREEGIPATAK